MAALRAYVEGEGAPPSDLVDARMAERVGWDWETLDRQDEGRTMRAVAILNLAAGYERVVRALGAGNLSGLAKSDWHCYKAIVDSDSGDA